MFLLILKSAGWVLAIIPESFVRVACAILGDLLYIFARRRRTTMLRNLHHAYPEKPLAWHRKIARESCRRLIEMGTFALASPWFNEKRARKILTIPEPSLIILNEIKASMPSGVGFIPHFTLTESLIMLSVTFPGLPSQSAIFRPLGNKTLDDWIKKTRERYGFKLFSRKEGFNQALSLVREGGWVTVLFDQNAGLSGALITAFQRVASATILPGLIAKKLQVPMFLFYAHRKAFWRADFIIEPLNCKVEPLSATLEANAKLEKYLNLSDDTCADWLWLHDRWKNQDMPNKRFHLEQKKNWLPQSINYHNWKSIPRKTRFWIRLPNWLGDVLMALPLIRALKRGRPDAEITLLTKVDFIPLLDKIELADSLIALPSKSISYFFYFKSLRIKYPDTYILFTNSLRGDIEAFLTGCPQRFGIIRSGQWRPLLTHAWKIPSHINENTIHQTRVLEMYFQYYGLREQLDFIPLLTSGDANRQGEFIGLICGSENEPQKRWPVNHWCKLADQILDDNPKIKLILFGTARDREITQQIAEHLPLERVTDIAGKTNLLDFCNRIRECRLILCNDTGGMHLANALGIPVVALFGPTNPLRTGPTYEAPVHILQPPACPPTGGLALSEIKPESVLSLVNKYMD